jgi:hypothetical protein
MCKCKWFWSAVAVLPLLAAGAWYGIHPADHARASDREEAEAYTCPLTGEQLPCPDCCPLNRQAKNTARTDCCDDPTCPPGCCPECPPDCLDAKAKAGTKAKSNCPLCPICP